MTPAHDVQISWATFNSREALATMLNDMIDMIEQSLSHFTLAFILIAAEPEIDHDLSRWADDGGR